jgi:hypothetical protein
LFDIFGSAVAAFTVAVLLRVDPGGEVTRTPTWICHTALAARLPTVQLKDTAEPERRVAQLPTLLETEVRTLFAGRLSDKLTD